MNFNKLNINELILKDSIKNSKDIIIQPFNSFYTPKVYVPFGISEYKKSFSLNLQLRHLNNNDELIEFKEFIEKLETKLKDLLEISDNEFISQLRINPDSKYDPIVYTKIINKFDKLECTVINNSNENLNIYDIGSKFYCKCLLSLDKVWLFRNKYSYKFKLRELIIED